MGNDKFANSFDMIKRRLCALSYDHRYTTELLKQREGVLKVVRETKRFQDTSCPFIPIFWSANPRWNTNLNLSSVLREETLLRELDAIHDLVEIPSQPYFIFGVREGITSPARVSSKRSGNVRGTKCLTAAELISLVFFTPTLLWHSEIRYPVFGSSFSDGSTPVFGFVEGHFTFRAPIGASTSMTTLMHRACFL